jgi:DNA polymerase-1
MVAVAIDNSALIGLDLETTGLSSRTDRIRLLTLAVETIHGGAFAYVFDCFCLDPSPLWEVLAGKELAIHNASFDVAFLFRLGFVPKAPIHCTLLMARMLAAGGPDFYRCALKDCVKRVLGYDLDKTYQHEDWSGDLTPEMLRYAARDAVAHRRLYEALRPEIHKAGLTDVLRIEERALPAFVWLALAGAPFDRAAWQMLAEEACHEAAQLAQRLGEAAPKRQAAPDKPWNWGSPKQVKEMFALLDVELASTNDETLARVDHPLARLLRDYRRASKRADTYGATWAKHLADDDRIYASWNQLGSVAGRTSCSGPNLQQVPRDKRYRQCFAAPPGRALVKADYSQLQLRIAAKVSGDQAMLDAYQADLDLHTLTARQITGKQEVTKDDRQLAKAVNFGLLFGLGAKGLREYARSNYGLELTETQARQYRRAFFQAYPGLERWHKRAGNSRAKECRTLGGRRRLLDDKTPYTHRLNSPVQGTEADGAKLAMGLAWERRDQCLGAFPVLFGHDELVFEVDEDKAAVAADWLRRCMIDAMQPFLDPIPTTVDVQIGPTWAG